MASGTFLRTQGIQLTSAEIFDRLNDHDILYAEVHCTNIYGVKNTVFVKLDKTDFIKQLDAAAPLVFVGNENSIGITIK